MTETTPRTFFAGLLPTARNLPAIVPKDPTLPGLAGEVRLAHADASEHLAKGAAACIRAGEALIYAKKMLKENHGHGNWLDFVTLECSLKERTAQVYMKLAREKEKLEPLLAPNPQSPAFLSQNAALEFLSAAKHKAKRRPRQKTD